MSDSIGLLTQTPTEIDVERLLSETNHIARYLLNQSNDFSLDLEVTGELGEWKLPLSPNEKLLTLIEHKYLKYGVLFSYGLDPYWESHSTVPMYEFCITEIPRKNDDMLLIICISLAISAAKILQVKNIVDYCGVWSVGSDSVSIEYLLALSVDRCLPLDQSLKLFYEQLPAFKIAS